MIGLKSSHISLKDHKASNYILIDKLIHYEKYKNIFRIKMDLFLFFISEIFISKNIVKIMPEYVVFIYKSTPLPN